MLLLRSVVTGILSVVLTLSYAQNMYLCKLDYLHAVPSRIAQLPGMVPSVTDQQGLPSGVAPLAAVNATFDENHQRMIFLGTNDTVIHAIHSKELRLYTVDAVSGKILHQPAYSSYGISRLQYDNTVDTLYAMVTVGTSIDQHYWLAWIDAVTGAVQLVKELSSSGIGGGSTFDAKDRRLISQGVIPGSQTDSHGLSVIGVPRGNVMYQNTFQQSFLSPSPDSIVGAWYFMDPLYNNISGELYGLTTSYNNGAGHGAFCRIDPATAIAQIVTEFGISPVDGGIAINAAIDQKTGLYVAVVNAGIARGTSCTTMRLYSIDMARGTVVSDMAYPYIFNPTGEAISHFVVDQKRGILYALNWHIENDGARKPAVQLTASTETICPGDTVVFKATIDSSIKKAAYQWEVNGQIAGYNNPVFTTNNLHQNDTVVCIVNNNTDCNLFPLDTTNTVVIRYKPLAQTAVTIRASATALCAGDSVEFTATPSNAGKNPGYQWWVNYQLAADSTPVFTTAALHDGDSIRCVMASHQACALPTITSNKIGMIVHPVPSVTLCPDTVILPGSRVALDTRITGTYASYQWTPATDLDNARSLEPQATPETSTVYELKLTTDQQCTATAKTAITVYRPLRMPNAFTPNNDGRNDLFRVPFSTQQKVARFVIFNRLGQEIFETHDCSAGWDGTYHGQPSLPGAYVWLIEYQDLLSKKAEKATGTVLLIR